MLMCIYSILRSAMIFAAVTIIAFSSPMSAHSGMGDHSAVAEQSVSHDHMDHTSHGAVHAPTPDTGNHPGQHAETGCCFGVCAAAILLMDRDEGCAKQSEEHEPLPVLIMTSVEPEHLIRPPNH